MITLTGVSARGPADKGKARAVLRDVTLEARPGVLAVLGAPTDGTTLLLDLLDGTATPQKGRVLVHGGSPAASRLRVARVALDAPLPDALRVDEVCAFAAELRGERRAPVEVLAGLGLESLAPRRVRSLAFDERRAVALALALALSQVDVLLVEEPLVIAPVSSRLVVDALRARAATACVVVTTSSASDAARLGDRLAVLTAGALSEVPPSGSAVASTSSVRVVVARDAASLIAALGLEPCVLRIETATYADASSTFLIAHGGALAPLARAVTRAIAVSHVDVTLIEPVGR